MRLSFEEQTIYGLLAMVGDRGIMMDKHTADPLKQAYDSLVAKGLATRESCGRGSWLYKLA